MLKEKRVLGTLSNRLGSEGCAAKSINKTNNTPASYEG